MGACLKKKKKRGKVPKPGASQCKHAGPCPGDSVQVPILTWMLWARLDGCIPKSPLVVRLRRVRHTSAVIHCGEWRRGRSPEKGDLPLYLWDWPAGLSLFRMGKLCTIKWPEQLILPWEAENKQDLNKEKSTFFPNLYKCFLHQSIIHFFSNNEEIFFAQDQWK